MIARIAALLLFVCLAGRAVAADPVVIGQTHRIHSTVLSEERTYRVHLPPSYRWAENRRYPVLYLLDAPSQFAPVTATVDYLSDSGEIPELIVVGIDNTSRMRDFTPTDWEAWVGGGGASRFKQFLAAELIPTIEANLRTNDFRVLHGHSLGGLFALYCLAGEPSPFRAYLALAPSLDWDGNWPQHALEKSFAANKATNAFLYVARADDSGRPLADYDALVGVLKKAPKGVRWNERAFPDETHRGMSLLATIDGLRRLYDGYRYHPDLMPKGLAYAEKHYADVSKTVGTALPVPGEVYADFGEEAIGAGRKEEGLALVRRGVDIDPQSPGAWDRLARAYASLDRRDDAVRSAERALELANRYEETPLSYYVDRLKRVQAMPSN